MTTLAQRRKKPVTIGPRDHGTRMPLAVFDTAIGVEGYRYELSKGVIEVSEIPSLQHMVIFNEARLQFTRYQLDHEGVIHFILGGGESKVSIEPLESERHPDLSIYMTAAPQVDQPWAIWRPQIVIEIVSASSVKRDYEEKPPEYLALGISEYWIIDPIRREMLVKQNVRGAWQDKLHKPAGKPVTSPLLPGFAFDLKKALGPKK